MTTLPDRSTRPWLAPVLKTYRTTGGTNDGRRRRRSRASQWTGRGSGGFGSRGHRRYRATPAAQVRRSDGGSPGFNVARNVVSGCVCSSGTWYPCPSDGTWARRYRRQLPSWIQPGCRELGTEIARNLYRESDLHFPDVIRRARWNDLNSATLGTTLDLDHAAAAHGVEFRYPFLDEDLVSMVLTVPTELWPRPSANARIHRGPLAEMLPPTLKVRRTKALFSEPVARRLSNMRTTLHGLLYAEEWLSERLWIAGGRSLVQDLLSSDCDADWSVVRGVWGIATLSLASHGFRLCSRQELAAMRQEHDGCVETTGRTGAEPRATTTGRRSFWVPEPPAGGKC